MDESSLQISGYAGEGYKPLVDYAGWRVAVLRYIDELQPNKIESMERHTQTDEVFVLLFGQGVLLLGGNEARVSGIDPQVMEHSKLYNVKRNAWHSILLSRDATVLIVENRDTDRSNSEYASLTSEQRHSIMVIAGQFIPSGIGDS
jgi:ureidoglycolate hydrolase